MAAHSTALKHRQAASTPPLLVGLAGTASLSGALKPTTYAYDANGNTIAIDGPSGPVTLTWDAENRLVGLDGPEGTETYDYDSTTSVPGKVTGLRRSKTTAAGTTHFVWDQQNLLAELDESLERLSQYTGFPGGWGGLASARAGASSSFYGFDLSANTRAVFDAAGAVDETALYSAFGPMVAGNLSGPFRYGGEVQYYTDARWLQVRARELDPWTGRWLSRDPLGRVDADWPFGYVGNGPVDSADPSGLLGFDEALLAVFVAAISGLAAAIARATHWLSGKLCRCDSQDAGYCNAVSALAGAALGLILAALNPATALIVGPVLGAIAAAMISFVCSLLYGSDPMDAVENGLISGGTALLGTFVLEIIAPHVGLVLPAIEMPQLLGALAVEAGVSSLASELAGCLKHKLLGA